MDELIPGGLGIGETSRVAALLEADGRIDYVNTTVAGYHNMFRAVAPSDEGDGYLVGLAAQIKAATQGIPVFAVGGIKHPELAEDVVASGKADVVAMIRAQIADPEWVAKARRAARTRSCTASAATRAASAASRGACRSRAPSTRPPAANGASAPGRSSPPRSRRAGSSPAAAPPACAPPSSSRCAGTRSCWSSGSRSSAAR